MSVWQRLRGWVGGSRRERAPTAAPEPAAEQDATSEATASGPSGVVGPTDASAPATAADRLAGLLTASEPLPVEREVVTLFDAACAEGLEMRAIDLARRLVAVHPELTSISLRVAETLASRGDDAGAETALAPLLAAPLPPLSTLVLAGELAERRGDSDRALSFYERALARDVDFPRAKERAARLREGRAGPRDLAGATLLADGALARGRYRIVRELGRGGAGTVFAAHDLRTGRTIALKVYHARGKLERTRLEVEARAAASFEHPGVIRIFDFDPALAAIAMERVAGGSIRGELKKGPVPIVRALRWMHTAVDALRFVHAAGVVHRDLKPSNMLLRADDRVVLADFGLALATGTAPAQRAGEGAEGTLAYMPPEQREAAAAAPPADVYALGATLREMLAQATGAVPPTLIELADACTARDPAGRPSLDRVAAALGA